jgi:hypothetical protein
MEHDKDDDKLDVPDSLNEMLRRQAVMMPTEWLAQSFKQLVFRVWQVLRIKSCVHLFVLMYVL